MSGAGSTVGRQLLVGEVGVEEPERVQVPEARRLYHGRPLASITGGGTTLRSAFLVFVQRGDLSDTGLED